MPTRDGTGPHGKGQGPGQGQGCDPEQLAMGIEIEFEHTNDQEIAKQIALDHLAEIPDYYTRLKKMEDEAKAGTEDVTGEPGYVDEQPNEYTTVAEYLASRSPLFRITEARKYIKDPSQAPKGASVERGDKGGYYYDTDGGAGGAGSDPLADIDSLAPDEKKALGDKAQKALQDPNTPEAGKKKAADVLDQLGGGEGEPDSGGRPLGVSDPGYDPTGNPNDINNYSDIKDEVEDAVAKLNGALGDEGQTSEQDLASILVRPLLDIAGKYNLDKDKIKKDLVNLDTDPMTGEFSATRVMGILEDQFPEEDEGEPAGEPDMPSTAPGQHAMTRAGDPGSPETADEQKVNDALLKAFNDVSGATTEDDWDDVEHIKDYLKDALSGVSGPERNAALNAIDKWGSDVNKAPKFDITKQSYKREMKIAGDKLDLEIKKAEDGELHWFDPNGADYGVGHPATGQPAYQVKAAESMSVGDYLKKRGFAHQTTKGN